MTNHGCGRRRYHSGARAGSRVSYWLLCNGSIDSAKVALMPAIAVSALQQTPKVNSIFLYPLQFVNCSSVLPAASATTVIDSELADCPGVGVNLLLIL